MYLLTLFLVPQHPITPLPVTGSFPLDSTGREMLGAAQLSPNILSKIHTITEGSEAKLTTFVEENYYISFTGAKPEERVSMSKATS